MVEYEYYQPVLLEPARQDTIVLNARCVIYEDAEIHAVMLNGMPIARYHRDDLLARDLFIAQAQDAGYASATELAAAFGIGERTAYRIRQRYLADGATGVVRKKRGPKGPRLGAAREAAIRMWSREGRTVTWMAHRLRVSRATVRRALVRMELPTGRREGTREPLLPIEDLGSVALSTEGASGEAKRVTDTPRKETPDGTTKGSISEAPVVASSRSIVLETGPRASLAGAELDGQPATEIGPPAQGVIDSGAQDRQSDRILASMGQLDDAAPVFERAEGVPRAGVLLAVPALVQSGVFEVGRETYGTLGPAFYGLRSILLILVIMALLRIKRPENLKEHSPEELGRIVGLDRSPEAKTVRRKLKRLSEDADTAEHFIAALASRRAQKAGDALGYLYVDGHVRVYAGQAKVPKAHVARMRLSMPATQDVWVNDANGDPLFVITQEPNRQLVSVLPKVLTEIRQLVGSRRVTVVFDRGGWSPELFQRMHKDGYDVLTYRKGRAEPIPDDQFITHELVLPTGKLTYELHDSTIVVGDNFEMRQVTRRKGDHQTHIVTTRTDMAAVDVARRMFDRWRQENFFKYMRQEFAIDALVEYGTEPDDPERLVPNPERRAVDLQLAKAKDEAERLEVAHAKACAEGQARETQRIPGFTPIYGMKFLKPLEDARRRVKQLEKRRSRLPLKIPVGSLDEPYVRLLAQTKRISDALKMVAYQTETDLVRAAAAYMSRWPDEGRAFIRAALQSTGDIQPTQDELRITLAPQSTPARTAALARLCSDLNDTRTRFPGTSLRLRYSVRGAETAR